MQAKGTTRAAVLTGALTVGVYILAIRPWHLTWSSPPEERRRPMLGDERVDRPWLIATRAITIDATP